jgi:hypothetical protein
MGVCLALAASWRVTRTPGPQRARCQRARWAPEAKDKVNRVVRRRCVTCKSPSVSKKMAPVVSISPEYAKVLLTAAAIGLQVVITGFRVGSTRRKVC